MADRLYLFRNDEFLGTLDFTNVIPDNDFVFRYDDAYFSGSHAPLDGISFDIGKAVQEIRPSIF